LYIYIYIFFFCLGYANEVGEAFRPSVHVNWVRLSYGIASAYVLADTLDKTLKMSKVCTFIGNKKLFVVVLMNYNSVTFI
jgi:fission process protein 1